MIFTTNTDYDFETFFQVCQSAWAYRKARGIPYPQRFSKPWLAAVLLPWRFAPGEREDDPKRKEKVDGSIIAM